MKTKVTSTVVAVVVGIASANALARDWNHTNARQNYQQALRGSSSAYQAESRAWNAYAQSIDRARRSTINVARGAATGAVRGGAAGAMLGAGKAAIKDLGSRARSGVK